jgi:hypothetical protein
MRIKKCSFRYLGADEGVFPTVHRGTVLTTEGSPMKVTLLQYDGERNRMVNLDQLAKAEVSDGSNGTLIFTGVSALAEGEFGPGNAQVRVEVTPLPGCKGCGK